MADDDEIAFEIYKTNLIANMGGQMFVQEVELETQRELAAPSGPDVPFFRLPFKEAIEHFTSKKLMTFDQFEALSDAERFRSFALNREVSNALVRKVKKALDDIMGENRSQATLRDFVAEFEGKADGLTSNYLENVMRTSTSSSYNAGRKRAQDSEAVATALPFRQYVTAWDSRVSPYCEPYHLHVWSIQEFPDELYPPNHFQCRSVVVSRSAEQAKRYPSGSSVSGAPSPQKGFNAAPDTVVAEEAGVGDATLQSSVVDR